ncbi:hypothetical protein LCGC14_0909690 [marine sediment metagenome]|uniref:Uncharacterized protein n=1 Tax=marine sediment metagenome TaxID=412755 RepID=A0A0F9RCW3_9ZZZZ
MLMPATLSVNGNEKAYSYLEMQGQAPDSSGFHRYRVLCVNRDGKLAEYREDMGKAELWKGAKQLNIPSLWEHTCAELIALANELRWETDIDVRDWLELEKYNVA